jgi:hypothetical protein
MVADMDLKYASFLFLFFFFSLEITKLFKYPFYSLSHLCRVSALAAQARCMRTACSLARLSRWTHTRTRAPGRSIRRRNSRASRAGTQDSSQRYEASERTVRHFSFPASTNWLDAKQVLLWMWTWLGDWRSLLPSMRKQSVTYSLSK